MTDILNTEFAIHVVDWIGLIMVVIFSFAGATSVVRAWGRKL